MDRYFKDISSQYYFLVFSVKHKTKLKIFTLYVFLALGAFYLISFEVLYEE